MNIQKELDNATSKEQDLLINNLTYLAIGNFSYRGKSYSKRMLMDLDDSILFMESTLLSDGTIYLNGSIVKLINRGSK